MVVPNMALKVAAAQAKWEGLDIPDAAIGRILDAAFPHIEKALRTDLAAEIRASRPPVEGLVYTNWIQASQAATLHAARVAEGNNK